MTVLISSIVDWARPHLPGCSTPQIIGALRDSAIEFCKQTRTLRLTAEIALANQVSEYELYAGLEVDVIGIEAVTQNGRPIHPAMESWLDLHVDQWRTEQQQDATNYVMPSRRTIRPYPSPLDALYPLVVTSVCQPTIDADSLDADMIIDWRNGITSGALWRLMLLPGQEWSNPAMAEYHRAEFFKIIGEARVSSVRGNTSGPLRADYQSFGGVNGHHYSSEYY